jgi:hypothetical protein
MNHKDKDELRPGDQYRVLAERCTEGELVEGEALATGVDNPGPRCLSEPEGAHLHRRHLVDPLVVGHGAHDHRDQIALHSYNRKMNTTSSLALWRKTAREDWGSHLPLHELDEASHRERRAVGLAHEQALQDHGVEAALGTPHQEAVELRARSGSESPVPIE